MVVETAMELAVGGRRARDAMMRMDSGDGPSPEDELHQLFRHYPLIEGCTLLHMSSALKYCAVTRIGNGNQHTKRSD